MVEPKPITPLPKRQGWNHPTQVFKTSESAPRCSVSQPQPMLGVPDHPSGSRFCRKCASSKAEVLRLFADKGMHPDTTFRIVPRDPGHEWGFNNERNDDFGGLLASWLCTCARCSIHEMPTPTATSSSGGVSNKDA
eukprot:CAMPEP_0169477990 /NCGR_PEP_ID=MMETSP1042-20121227/28226_1 /TAXON_ID=464988 /ORGANISM="Hemiselmis andersenii, Strain CCMP1180" /LENGTH=135 /DNA_ID=CAMNT_0009592407 /DNA_START=403 /DNA_END=811 /DNA_ORIENTATION=+